MTHADVVLTVLFLSLPVFAGFLGIAHFLRIQYPAFFRKYPWVLPIFFWGLGFALTQFIIQSILRY